MKCRDFAQKWSHWLMKCPHPLSRSSPRFWIPPHTHTNIISPCSVSRPWSYYPGYDDFHQKHIDEPLSVTLLQYSLAYNKQYIMVRNLPHISFHCNKRNPLEMENRWYNSNILPCKILVMIYHVTSCPLPSTSMLKAIVVSTNWSMYQYILKVRSFTPWVDIGQCIKQNPS